MIILYTVALYLCGSLMFSYWLGFLAKKNLRSVGDGNPGAANLWQAAGAGFGLLGVFLDFMKGYLPLAILLHFQVLSGYAVVPAAFAPVIGHAFSPFLKFRGGKCTTVTFGVWSAVTKFEVSIVYAVILALLLLAVRLLRGGKQTDAQADASMTVSGMVLAGVYLIVRGFPYEILLLWILNLMLLLYTNRVQLLKSVKTVIRKSS